MASSEAVRPNAPFRRHRVDTVSFVQGAQLQRGESGDLGAVTVVLTSAAEPSSTIMAGTRGGQWHLTLGARARYCPRAPGPPPPKFGRARA